MGVIDRSIWILAKVLFALVLMASFVAISTQSVRAADYVVDTLADSGPGSLRQAILDANSTTGADTISFDVDGTIPLSSSNGLAMQITEDLTIDGAGHNVTVDGLNVSPIFWAYGTPATFINVGIKNLTLTNGSAGSGGAFASSYANVTIDRVSFVHNFAHDGGAVSLFRVNSTIANSTFSDNGTNTAGGLGGDGSGGAVWVGDDATNDPGNTYVVVSNSTFTGNSSRNAGGVLMNQNGNVTIINSTIAGNSTTDQNNPPLVADGAVFNFDLTNSKITLKNTIVANNAGGNCVNAITDGGNNLTFPATDVSCPGTNADPLLGALQDNGGPTQTMLPGAGSAAIDAGDDSICAAAPVNNLDQRGVTRPQGVACDIGAVEVVFDFNGFFQPVDNPGPGPSYVFNRVKAGSAVPVKFSLNGDQGLDIFAAGYPVSKAVSCDLSTVDTIEQTVTAGNSSLSYDAASDQYTYVWKTAAVWKNSCRVLVVKLTDGSQHTAYFQFTK